jgi:hypothetical protein
MIDSIIRKIITFLSSFLVENQPALVFLNSDDHYKKQMKLTEFKDMFKVNPTEELISVREQNSIYSKFEIDNKANSGKSANMIISYFISPTLDKQYVKEFLTFMGVDFQHVDSLTIHLTQHTIYNKTFYYIGINLNEDAFKVRNKKLNEFFHFIVAEDKAAKFFTYYKPMLFEFKDKRLKVKSTLKNFK